MHIAASEAEEGAAPADEPAPFVPRDAPEEALAAAARAGGFGLIRCDLPADAPADLYAVGLHRVVRTGPRLTAAVVEPEGLTQLSHPFPGPELLQQDQEAWLAALDRAAVPAGLLAWGEAFPGEQGWCRHEEPTRITLRGRIVTPDGAPAADAWLNGCADGSTYPDAEGNFVLQTWRGGPCVLSVRSSGIPGDGLQVRRDADQEGLVVVDGPKDVVANLDAEAAELARQEAEAHPLEVALEDQSLSPGARELLQTWLADERAEAEEKRGFQERAADFFDEVRAAEEDAAAP
ncbi:MAG: hypothetical protein ABIO70_00700 [Pseudomonadota bacterium]